MTAEPTARVAAGGRGNVRASDADRERVIGVLNEAFAEGRLTREELDARAERTYGAKTHTDLAAVSADLPAGPVPALPPAGPGGPAAHPGTADRTNRLAVVVLVCGLIPGIPQLAAIILGVEALRQIRRTGERGAVLAGAGLVLATLGLVVAALLVLR